MRYITSLVAKSFHEILGRRSTRLPEQMESLFKIEGSTKSLNQTGSNRLSKKTILRIFQTIRAM